jgi:hypothetical protein
MRKVKRVASRINNETGGKLGLYALLEKTEQCLRQEYGLEGFEEAEEAGERHAFRQRCQELAADPSRAHWERIDLFYDLNEPREVQIRRLKEQVCGIFSRARADNVILKAQGHETIEMDKERSLATIFDDYPGGLTEAEQAEVRAAVYKADPPNPTE